MDQPDQGNDVGAIDALIARQFASLNWSLDTPADWETFASDFLPGAVLYPATRPVAPQTVDGFVQRMQGLAGGQLRFFHESVGGTRIHVFGNVAVAVAVSEITEKEDTKSRSVEMLLLVKEDGAWRIAAQAWDTERDAKPIPAGLVDPP